MDKAKMLLIHNFLQKMADELLFILKFFFCQEKNLTFETIYDT